MANYFIGIDFGTVNTKVCVREDVAPVATPVTFGGNSGTADDYLLPSSSADWLYHDPPKVVLLQPRVGHDLDALAQDVAVTALVRAAEAAVRHVERETGSAEHRFTINIGYPSISEIDPGDVLARYQLILDTAVHKLQRMFRGGVKFEIGVCDMDERIAALQHLSNAKFELRTGPVCLVDGGGYTLHTTVVRWNNSEPEQTGLSVHGATTVVHGMSFVVDAIRHSAAAVLHGARLHDLIRILETVMKGVYDEGRFGNVAAARDPLKWEDGDFGDKVAERAAQADMPGGPDAAEYLTQCALAELRLFFTKPIVKAAWQRSWAAAWNLSKERRFWHPYPLLMTGGACRVGRNGPGIDWDPLATVYMKYQGKIPVAQFTQVLYPELDRRFWPSQDASTALQAAIPYLFVACGYTYPLDEWPKRVKPEAVTRPLVRPQPFMTTPDISG